MMDWGRNGAARSVLVIEDDPSSLAPMVECLLRDGFQVTTAASGADALDAARRRRFDAFVIDVFLPDAGGLGVAHSLVRQGQRGSLPVLFITALSSPAVRAALSPAPVLYKPFRRAQLVDAIGEVIRRPPTVLPAARAALEGLQGAPG
jgi:two-component system OmpR family response regulator